MKTTKDQTEKQTEKTAYQVERARLIRALLNAPDQYQLAYYMQQLKQLARRHGL